MMESEVMGNYHASFGERDGETRTVRIVKVRTVPTPLSPILANVFLHHVLDEWFVKDVLPRMQGHCFLSRFADDFIIGCEREADARRIMDVLPKRFPRFRLTIHPEKTALIAFRRPPSRDRSAGGTGTFDFLGFTHYWAKTRQGYWVIKRKT